MSAIKTTILVATFAIRLPLCAATATIPGWNNLGMHCMDSDYSVFSILPPYNTIQAQLIVNGTLVTSSNGYTVTYQAVADPSGSINKTSVGKGNWLQFAPLLYGAVAADQGLAFPGPESYWMPGTNNTPQAMFFERTNQPAAGVFTPVNWFHAYGIPITPRDDAGNRNPYPLMLVVARDAANNIIATNQIVLPVSDEMDCRACHASGPGEAARPAAGWVWDGLPERDFRLNILRLHDEKNFASNAVLYAAALAARGFNPAGLYRGVTADGKPVLCAACHASEALAAHSYGTVPPLTTSVHAFHGHVSDPVLNVSLDNSANRSACYRCHPGSTTKCLRGAMGGAIAADGSMEMQCQSCHGNMSAVGSTNRIGWFMEPNCQNCHSGTAARNNGQIRYTSAFDTNGLPRVPVDRTFATTPDTPASGLSLYRFSVGHGGLQCSACHGSTHAEFPSTHGNDNLRNIELQGHAGMLVECTACHVTITATTNTMSGGPHGMHPITQDWVDNHHDLVNQTGGAAQCQTCHGASSNNYPGTVLSRTQTTRTWNLYGGTITFFRGAQIGCYTCHSGPTEGDQNLSVAPTVSNVSTNTANDKSVGMALPATGVGLTLRIVSQPANGAVGLSNGVATYFPSPGFVGTDTFTFAAYDGAKNSNLGTGTVNVAQGPFSIGAQAHVPPTYPAGWPVAFSVEPNVTNNTAGAAFDWNFGDSSAHGTSQYAAHTYAVPGSYSWTIVSTVTAVSATNTGIIVIGNPVVLEAAKAGSAVTISWRDTVADSLLEGSSALGPAAHWTWITNSPSANAGLLNVTLPSSGNKFFRVRRPW